MQSIFNGVDTTSLTGVTQLIANITNIAFYAVGVVSVVFVVVGGIQLITSSGNPDGLKKARKTITMAVGGLVLAIGATAIGNFILGSIK